jgi:hypothetical protein
VIEEKPGLSRAFAPHRGPKQYVGQPTRRSIDPSCLHTGFWVLAVSDKRVSFGERGGARTHDPATGRAPRYPVDGCSVGISSARCSPPPSQTASRLRPRSRRRRNDIGGRIIIANISGAPLANDVGGEQPLNIGKAGQIAQKVAPSPGSAVSFVTSAHDVTRQGLRPNPRLLF